MRKFTPIAVLALAAAITVVLTTGGAATAQKPVHPRMAGATGALRPAVLETGRVSRTMPFFSGSSTTTVRSGLGLPAVPGSAAKALSVRDTAPGTAAHTLGCSARNGGVSENVRVNQDCTFRRQAEEAIIYNPANPDNLLAGQNDSRVGFNQCGIDYSLDAGQTWGDLLPPFRQRLNSPETAGPNTIAGGQGTFHSYDAASDPTVAFDSQGRGYFSCVMFDVADDASAILVTQSPAAANGQWFFNVGPTGRTWVADEENNAAASLDKQFIAADFYSGSPNRDNVYVTFTVFDFEERCNGYCASPIYGSMSTDGARTWSHPVEISGTSSLCFFGNYFDPNRPANACDFDQGSDPVVLPNGDLVVIFNNGNTAQNNPNLQQLVVRCHPTGSSSGGTANLNCGAPVKAGDDVVTGEPQCDFGRGPEECIPGPFIRTNDYPRIVNNARGGVLYAAWQDYRNGEYDVWVTRSTDNGQTWSGAQRANQFTGFDSYMPAVDQPAEGSGGLGVSYFRSQRVPGENSRSTFKLGEPGVGTSNSDYVLGVGGSLPLPVFVLSPVFPAPDGNQAGFNGDYSDLSVAPGRVPHAIWSDTRNSESVSQGALAHDEDVFTATAPRRQGLTASTASAGSFPRGARAVRGR